MVKRTIEVQRDAQEVWAALTEPERLSDWFGATAVEVELRPGGRITFERGDARWRGLVEEVEPPWRFAFRWLVREDQPARDRTRVEFLLEPVKGGTRLTVHETPLWPESEARHGAIVGATA
jgi:uncharacterized protein YndB with AHSA1/START domain